jgi:hypothetical protein
MCHSSVVFTAEHRLSMIPLMFDKHGIMFSKTEAAKLVGGRGKLVRLIEQGKIKVEKPSPKQNGKWFCRAGDVIKHLRF